MSSFSRNSCRSNFGLRRRALGAGFALMLVSGAALADRAHRFVFTAYSDGAGGSDIMAGRYRAALEELKSYPGTMDLNPSAANSNRCVAYSMTLQWQQARMACDAAVRDASGRRNTLSASASWTRSSDDEYLALAYANRAVMHWLWNDDAAAQKDLTKAQELSPQADFVAQNVAAYRMHVSVALAGAPAPKR